MVRQTSDEIRQVTMAWTYSPTGGIVLGTDGPVTNLDCGSGGIYDWSTGLIFKNGRYFDPNTGIWITMGMVVTWQLWPKENRRQRRWRKRYGNLAKLLIPLLLLLLLATALSGCGCTTIPPTATPGPTETQTSPPPTLPPPIISDPTAIANPPVTPISTPPPPTVTSIPPTLTNTPIPPTPTSTPYPGVPVPTFSVFPGDSASLVTPFGGIHSDGIDLVPSGKRRGYDDAARHPVVTLHDGLAYNGSSYGKQFEIFIKDTNSKFEVTYAHVRPEPTIVNAAGELVEAGSQIGTLVYAAEDEDNIVGDLAHLHLGLKILPEREHKDPSFLILFWGQPGVDPQS